MRVEHVALDLTNGERRNTALVRGCAAIERACWTPRLTFEEYLADARWLFASLVDGQPVAFSVFRDGVCDGVPLVSFDEAMVDPRHRRQGIITAQTWFAARHITKDLIARRAKRIVVCAMTSSEAAIRGLYRFRHLFPTHSFAPTKKLRRIVSEYTSQRGMTTVNGDPFVIKEVYRGGPRERLEDGILRGIMELPEGTDLYERGDAILFAALTDARLGYALSRTGGLLLYGPRYFR